MSYRLMTILGAVVVTSHVAACGGGTAPTAPSPPSVLSVRGSYAVTKAYIDTSCGTDLASLVTTIVVEHEPGSSTLLIREGFGTYHGQVAADGRFEAAQPAPEQEHDPPVRVMLRDGRFTTNGLEARNVWEMYRNGIPQGPTCTGALSYSGRKTAGTNTFP